MEISSGALSIIVTIVIQSVGLGVWLGSITKSVKVIELSLTTAMKEIKDLRERHIDHVTDVTQHQGA